MGDLISLLIAFVMLVIASITGSIAEKRHYKSIKEREIALLKLPSVNIGKKALLQNKKVQSAYVVIGSVVIGSDGFKDFIASFRRLLGGRMISYESLLDRARREAILRMKESAIDADIIINTKFETSMTEESSKKNEPAKVAVMAYGTAIKYE